MSFSSCFHIGGSVFFPHYSFMSLSLVGYPKKKSKYKKQILCYVENTFLAMKVDVETAMNQGKLSMTGFNEIKSQVSILVDTIRVLRDNSASIGSISDTINAISDETNILSFNARIEAARGQTDGKGFKVIAEEVGLLAKQSKAATNDIKARLELLGEKIAATITAVETVEQHVAACERQILDANMSMEHVYSQSGRKR